MTRAPARSKRDVVADALGTLQPDLIAFARSRVRPEDVDDLLQVAALRAIERADSLEDPARVDAWIYRIHRNLIIDSYRKTAAEQRHVDRTAELPEPAGEADTADELLGESCACSVSQAQRLRPSYATILTLIDSDGLPLGEAADRLGVTVNNATVRLHRARTALREAMFEHCGVTDPDECAACRCIDDACCDA